MLENLTFVSLIQYFAQVKKNLHITTVLLLFIEECYYLLDNINCLTEKTITNKNLKIVNIGLFQDRTIPISWTNKKNISIIISSLYTGNIQIGKKKG